MADPANSKSWKDLAEAAAAELAEVTAERDELRARLDEISGIAAPEDDPERPARIEQKLDALLKVARVETVTLAESSNVEDRPE